MPSNAPIDPDKLVFLDNPSEPVPPVMVILEDGSAITFEQFQQMQKENQYDGDDEEDA
jgi:hypothetical protein